MWILNKVFNSKYAFTEVVAIVLSVHILCCTIVAGVRGYLLSHLSKWLWLKRNNRQGTESWIYLLRAHIWECAIVTQFQSKPQDQTRSRIWVSFIKITFGDILTKLINFERDFSRKKSFIQLYPGQRPPRRLILLLRLRDLQHHLADSRWEKCFVGKECGRTLVLEPHFFTPNMWNSIY